ncbi:hypothetical protein [Sorangium sp. So ce388]|uniref:hypothetical protein n=1 Tax=Sorangium sp. So ce388 TaxID=3133309 RepID=UPI003F5B9937
MDLILQIGVERIHEHANRFLDPLEEALRERGWESLRAEDPALRGCALGVRPPGGASVVELHRELTHLGIACAIPDGVLRFSPHWPDALDEWEQALLSTDEALARVRKG